MSNIDTDELSKFDDLANTWWDRNGEFKSLHDINPLRVDYIESYVGGVFGKTIVDIGCGGGILAEELAARGAIVTGIDMVQRSLDVAKLHMLESGADDLQLNYALSTVEDWADKHEQQYDIVTCLEMLEHVPDPSSIVRACARLTKPGGRVIFSTLNKNLKSYLLAIITAEHVLGMVPKGTHDYQKFIMPAALNKMIEQTELVPEHITGLHFNPLANQYYLSDTNVDVNYFIACRKE
ncbi:bifunctional 2-polyprenyl-6-hydroxyphenol methylase/3-demethylubiquinol 3-O-methyltransferase UbiG [Glaciecola petra]|uniref:Ubiquinone biosynthesis O-methyltransferase n=1 Tax=Glaciecola petra TaxID=3075602 RepID=A0ABU2ZNT6_9ALTE|nr:bifunctional 2-polyprenyl-6-hydroxyphenol methylase/3-demethylubiquinol 3-O-methyltransferase UbiG [Aestuariibacter sp. P117]MDT0594288.1 bifunctional 2-polyprenyl-6-hydroxyphenol methylase/3-demethylubiquinol 3-O-methyltransferase UbiG [Aestuariibacter sp. P117]